MSVVDMMSVVGTAAAFGMKVVVETVAAAGMVVEQNLAED